MFLAKPWIGVFMLGGGIITSKIAWHLRGETNKPAIKWFYVLMLAGTGWSITSGLETIIGNPTASIIIDRLFIITVTLASITWFLFAVEYTRKRIVPDKIFWTLLVVPLLTQVFVWTPQLHWLVYSSVTVNNGILSASFGPWGTFDMLIFSYSLVFAAFAILLTDLVVATSRARKVQTGIVFAGLAIPVGMSVAFNFNILTIDLIPYGMATGGLLFLVALEGDIVPPLFSVNQFAWAAAVQDLDNIIFSLNDNNVLTAANSAAQDIFELDVGMTKEEIVRKNDGLEPILEGEDPDGEIFHFESTDQYFSCRSSAIDYGRDATARTMVLQNITTQKQREQELERKNERLDKFASLVSHDLRNPLTAALGHLELIRDDVQDGYFETIQRNLYRMDEIIDKLLTLSKSGQSVETTGQVNLADTIEKAWRHVETDACTFDMEVTSERRIHADRGRLLNVFENLFRNACEHNDQPVTIVVGTMDSSENSGTLGVFVEDNGQGISDCEPNKVFEHGFTTSDDGTGFGLSIVQEIVDAHGWDIRVAEDYNNGVRFEITGIRVSDESEI